MPNMKASIINFNTGLVLDKDSEELPIDSMSQLTGVDTFNTTRCIGRKGEEVHYSASYDRVYALNLKNKEYAIATSSSNYVFLLDDFINDPRAVASWTSPHTVNSVSASNNSMFLSMDDEAWIMRPEESSNILLPAECKRPFADIIRDYADGEYNGSYYYAVVKNSKIIHKFDPAETNPTITMLDLTDDLDENISSIFVANGNFYLDCSISLNSTGIEAGKLYKSSDLVTFIELNLSLDVNDDFRGVIKDIGYGGEYHTQLWFLVAPEKSFAPHISGHKFLSLSSASDTTYTTTGDTISLIDRTPQFTLLSSADHVSTAMIGSDNYDDWLATLGTQIVIRKAADNTVAYVDYYKNGVQNSITTVTAGDKIISDYYVFEGVGSYFWLDTVERRTLFNIPKKCLYPGGEAYFSAYVTGYRVDGYKIILGKYSSTSTTWNGYSGIYYTNEVTNQRIIIKTSTAMGSLIQGQYTGKGNGAYPLDTVENYPMVAQTPYSLLWFGGETCPNDFDKSYSSVKQSTDMRTYWIDTDAQTINNMPYVPASFAEAKMALTSPITYFNESVYDFNTNVGSPTLVTKTFAITDLDIFEDPIMLRNSGEILCNDNFGEQRMFAFDTALNDTEVFDGIPAIWSTTLNSPASSGNISTANNRKYKLSLEYDGYQESCLSYESITEDFDATSEDFVKNIDIEITFNEALNSRVSRVLLYVKANDLDSYRLCDYSTRRGTFYKFNDSGATGATYDSLANLSETDTTSIMPVKYMKWSNGYMFALGAGKKEFVDIDNYLFRSIAGKACVFNWSVDYLPLDEKYHSIVEFNGRLMLLGVNSIATVNIEGMYLEKIEYGIGCIDKYSFCNTPYGICIAGQKNVYMYDGFQSQSLADNIKGTGTTAYEQFIKTSGNLSVNYNLADECIYVTNDGQATSTFVYSLKNKRWSMVDLNGVTTIDSEGNLYSITNTVNLVGTDTDTKNFTFLTNKIYFGDSNRDKFIQRIRFNGVGSFNYVITSDTTPFSGTIATGSTSAEINIKQTTRFLTIEITGVAGTSIPQIDSIQILYRMRGK